MTLIQWLVSGDCGLSSKFMAGRLSGEFKVQCHHPHDSGDFGRCVRFLEKFPQYRESLSLMAAASPQWAMFVQRWDELESLYNADRELTCDRRIQELLHGIQKGGE